MKQHPFLLKRFFIIYQACEIEIYDKIMYTREQTYTYTHTPSIISMVCHIII